MNKVWVYCSIKLIKGIIYLVGLFKPLVVEFIESMLKNILLH